MPVLFYYHALGIFFNLLVRLISVPFLPPPPLEATVRNIFIRFEPILVKERLLHHLIGSILQSQNNISKKIPDMIKWICKADKKICNQDLFDKVKLMKENKNNHRIIYIDFMSICLSLEIIMPKSEFRLFVLLL